MDQPQIHMRRHNSLPANRGSSSLLLRNVSNRFNPHVGTFRHAPPCAAVTRELKLTFTTSNKISTMSNYSSSNISKHFLTLNDSKSPYVGSFRHAPAYSNKSWLESALCELLFSHTHGQKGFGLSDLLMISGHLRGGSPYWRRQSDDNEGRHSSRSTSAVSSVLVKLACWVLFGEQPTKSSRIRNKSHSGSFTDFGRQDSVSDDSSMCTDSDDHSCCTTLSNGPPASSLQPSNQASTSTNLTLISSQAEAYYAHAMVSKETALTADISDEEAIANLDYTVSITQMDVVRMMRNASRHLDVESIVQLPVVTYQASLANGVEGDQLEQVVEKEEEAVEQLSSTGSFTSVADDSTATPEEMSWLLIRREEDGGSNKKNAAAVTTVANVQPKRSRETSDTDHICVICLEHFVAGDRLRVLPCHHSFHVGCIDRWLSGSSSFDDCITSGCPTCKKRPDMDETNVVDGSVPSWAFARIGNALATSQSG
ncbi:hypothetical protein MPSEU_000820900 [Mayamaea pseudoterrestris]|nr:hypothetical protein MPSEU_000820900 [Mayamaea pseudoterrestris]